MTDRQRRTTEDLARLLIDILQGGETRVSLIGATGDSGSDQPAFDNPMEEPGDLIEGDEGGSGVRLPIGTEGQVLTVTLVGAELRGRWGDATGGGGGGHYNQYVHALDSGTWEFVSVDIGGQLYPLTALIETE